MLEYKKRNAYILVYGLAILEGLNSLYFCYLS